MLNNHLYCKFQACLESFSQTSRDFEIILVIDFLNKLITIADCQTLSIFSSRD